ncbi:hypothetical protein NQ318_015297 [Aromia moschata]|uniref:Transposase n=1 Tax=Aromia moschata TaxID=1265417 RepID=A0AAV8XE91_9CUCU|nr:hypothetical protein NQ318_015297 [Aromia moschata]
MHHHPCVAHTINLIVNDALKSADNEQLINLLKQCRDLVTYFKHSALATNELKKCQQLLGLPILKIKQDVVTRWNSTLHMLQRLLDIKDSLHKSLANTSVLRCRTMNHLVRLYCIIKATRLDDNRNIWGKIYNNVLSDSFGSWFAVRNKIEITLNWPWQSITK